MRLTKVIRVIQFTRKNLIDIKGVIYAKDLIKQLLENPNQTEIR